MTQPAPHDDMIPSNALATATAAPWYRRMEVIVTCLAAFLFVGGSVGTWMGLKVYARNCWEKELARVVALNRATSEEQAEEQETARIPVQYPLGVYLGQVGAFVAVLPEEVRDKLASVEAFQESYLVVEYNRSGSRPSPEDAAAASFHGLFSADGEQIENFAKVIRTGEIPADYLPLMANLPADMPVLIALARKALKSEVLGIANAVKVRDKEGPVSWEDWWQNAQDNSASPIIYRMGPADMYYLMQRNYLREVEGCLTAIDQAAGGRTVPMPHQSEDPMLRTGGTTVTSVSTMLDLSAGALGSNMQRIIMAHALFRRDFKRNPRDINELITHGGLGDKMLTVEGTQLEIVQDGGRSVMRCTLDPALIETAKAIFVLLNDFELKLEPVIKVVLYDPDEPLATPVTSPGSWFRFPTTSVASPRQRVP